MDNSITKQLADMVHCSFHESMLCKMPLLLLIQDRKPEPKPGQEAPKARKTEKTDNGRTVPTIITSVHETAMHDLLEKLQYGWSPTRSCEKGSQQIQESYLSDMRG